MFRNAPAVALLVAGLVALLTSSTVLAQNTATPEATPEPILTTEFGPVPAGARGPAIPASGYLVEEIAGGLYWVTEGAYQTIFLTTGQGVILVDAPPSIGPNLALVIAEVTDEPVTHLVHTHHHTDHIGAAVLFPDVTIIAHEATAELLTRSADPT